MKILKRGIFWWKFSFHGGYGFLKSQVLDGIFILPTIVYFLSILEIEFPFENVILLSNSFELNLRNVKTLPLSNPTTYLPDKINILLDIITFYSRKNVINVVGNQSIFKFLFIFEKVPIEFFFYLNFFKLKMNFIKVFLQNLKF